LPPSLRGLGGAKKRPDLPKKIIKIQPEIKNKEGFLKRYKKDM
jgi:hypothetical protein